jgi:hypothetical protein
MKKRALLHTRMPWIECEKHPSVYYDSTVHKKCPACLNDALRETAKSFAIFAFDNYRYASLLLDWFGFGLEVLSPTSMTKEEASGKRELAHRKILELRETISLELKEILDLCENSEFKDETTSVLPEEKIKLFMDGMQSE